MSKFITLEQHRQKENISLRTLLDRLGNYPDETVLIREDIRHICCSCGTTELKTRATYCPECRKKARSQATMRCALRRLNHKKGRRNQPSLAKRPHGQNHCYGTGLQVDNPIHAACGDYHVKLIGEYGCQFQINQWSL